MNLNRLIISSASPELNEGRRGLELSTPARHGCGIAGALQAEADSLTGLCTPGLTPALRKRGTHVWFLLCVVSQPATRYYGQVGGLPCQAEARGSPTHPKPEVQGPCMEPQWSTGPQLRTQCERLRATSVVNGCEARSPTAGRHWNKPQRSLAKGVNIERICTTHHRQVGGRAAWACTVQGGAHNKNGKNLLPAPRTSSDNPLSEHCWGPIVVARRGRTNGADS